MSQIQRLIYPEFPDTYWKLFFWMLFRRPWLFPPAITLAIYGFHFRQAAALHVG